MFKWIWELILAIFGKKKDEPKPVEECQHVWGVVYEELVDLPCSTPVMKKFHNCEKCGLKEIVA